MSYSFRGSQSAGAESDGFVGLTAGRMSVGMVKIGGATEGLVMRGRKFFCQRERKRSFSEGELVEGGVMREVCVPLGLATAGGPKCGRREMGRETAKREKKRATTKERRSWNFMVRFGCGGCGGCGYCGGRS